jgi:NADPH:quinone reductase
LKAVLNTARGSARDTLVIQDIPTPSPGPGEVRVALRASGVNPSDSKLRSGAQGPMVADRVVIHNDGAGVIDAVGDGVDAGRIGQRVWLYNTNRSADGLGQGPVGTAAEFVCVPEAQAPTLPENTDFTIGACLGVPAMTAHRALMWAGPVAGKTVLVTGGAGSVGHSAIQIAKAMGARIITTVSSAQKAEIASAAGADATVNYREQNLETELSALAGPSGIHHVVDVDLAAHVPLYPKLLAPGANVGAYASATDLTPSIPFYPLAFSNISLQPVFVYSMSDAAKQQAIADINTLLSQSTLTPQIAKVFQCEDIVTAHEAVENTTLIGNAVIKI